MGYGMLWWVFRQPPFIDHGMVAALGVGDQMIAALPESGLVIVNRANTYESEGTPMDDLLDLIKAVLEARTGDSTPDPALVPFDEPEPDPRMTMASRNLLERFAGEWPYPPPSFGLPQMGTLKVSIDDDGLVLINPVAGTFREYLQDDGTLLEEDSLGHWVAIRDDDGTLEGIVNAEAAVEAAVAAATAGDIPRATGFLSLFEDHPSFEIDFAGALLEFFEGDRARSEAAMRELAGRTDQRFIEGRIASMGSSLVEAGSPDRAIEVFKLNTRLFPDSSSAWQKLGEAHMKQGNEDEATVFLEKAIELDEENTNAKEMLEQITAQQEPSTDPKEKR